MFFRSPRDLLIATLLAIAITACGDAAVVAPPVATQANASLLLVSRPPSTVNALVVEVTGPGISPPVTVNLTVNSAGVAEGIITVTPGGGRRIVVTALDTSGIPSHRADTTLRLLPGTNPPLSLTLLPLGASAPVVVTFGPVSVTITSPPPALVVGDTVLFTATVSRAVGGAVPADSIQWASGDPGVLSLTGARGAALREGSVVITASFAGFAATRLVNVGPTPLPALFAWRTAAPAPANTRGSYSAHDVARREVLVATTDNRILVYRIATNTWGEVPVSGLPTPAGEYQIAYDASGDRILLHWRGLGSVYAIPRAGGAAVQLGTGGDGSAYFDHVFGVNPVTGEPFTMAGYGFSAFRNTLWRFTTGNQWSALPITAPWPWPRQAPTGSIATSQRALYLFGGEGNASGAQSQPYTRLHSLWRLDFASGSWTALIPDNVSVPASAPAGRGTAMGVTPTGSTVYLYGPEVSPAGVPFQTLWRLRPGTDASFSQVTTTGTVPTSTQTAMMYFDGLSQDLVIVLREAPLQVIRIRVQS